MEKSIEEFVGIYKNAYSKEYCEEVIKQFKYLQKQGFTKNRQELEDMTKLEKDDHALFTGHFYTSEAGLNHFDNLIGEEFNRILWEECYPHYVNHFAEISTLPAHRNFGNKVQRTNVGQGYHIWHSEHGDGPLSRRILFYILYLNDVEEGGETEFLYQSKRYKAEQGTLIIAPASFTHTHRGNPPLSNDKFIITSWIEF